MKALITSEFRFVRTADQKIWTQTAFPYAYWKKYLKVFDEIVILGRAIEVSRVDDSWKEVTGARASFVALPPYRGPLGYVLSLAKIKSLALSSLRETDTAILSLPSPIALILGLFLIWQKRPYAVEVMGDPWEVLAKGGVRHPLRPLIRVVLTALQKFLVRRATSVAYVTQKSLQARYPSSPGSYSVGVSNVDLNDAHIATGPRDFSSAPPSGKTWKLVSVGSLEQLYKGPDVVLQAISILKAEGFSLSLSWAGEGAFLSPMRDFAARLGIEKDVHFLGQVSGGESVRTLLDDSDIFILASRTEGLPRAMIEAMARGLPCLGSDVGGIPELLDSDQLFAPGDVQSLATALRRSLSQPESLGQVSRENLEKSRQFLSLKLESKWSDFLRSLSKKLDKPSGSGSD